jgi:predicted transposase YbfD/YdcC
VPVWYERPVADESPELKVRLVADGEVAWYNALMAEHHSLGVAASGRVLRYVAEAGGVPLVLGTFGSAAWRVPVRDEFIGWDPVQRGERLGRVVCNQRLCVLPAAEAVPHAASRALAAMLRRLPGDHERAFGVRPAACESFTDPGTHAGTVYKACGFTQAGRTAGYGRSRGAAHFAYHGQPKAYWIRQLAPGAVTALTAAFDSAPLTGRAGPDFNALNVGGEGGLAGYLAKVADHRKAKGIRHGLAAILVVIVVARLSGADSVYAAAQFAASMPQEALRRCGIRYNQRLGRYVPPSHKTIKRAVRAVDAAAADQQMCAWLRAEAAAGRLRWRWRHIAVDGKTVRGAKDDGGKAPHLLAAYDVTAGAVLGQDAVDGKTNEISCFVPLLHAILASPRARRGPGQPAAGPGTDDDGRDTSGGGPGQAPGSEAAAAAGGGGGGGGEEEEEEELVIVTADAMHTQSGHVEAMNALGVAWMVILKDNQPRMYAAADAHPWDNEPVLHGSSQTGHGRHEIRLIKVTSQIPDLIAGKLPGAHQMLLIERYRHQLPRGGAPAACISGDPGDHDPLACAADCGMKLQAETVLAVTALTPAQAGPAFLLERNRQHWGIENGLHHRRDTTLGEDASRIRAGQAPRLFASIGNVVISVLNRAGHGNHAAARRDLAWDRTGTQALTLLGL